MLFRSISPGLFGLALLICLAPFRDSGTKFGVSQLIGKNLQTFTFRYIKWFDIMRAERKVNVSRFISNLETHFSFCTHEFTFDDVKPLISAAVYGTKGVVRVCFRLEVQALKSS